MKKFIFGLLVLPVFILSCSSNFFCKHCPDNYITKDSIIYHYKDTLLKVPFLVTIPKDSTVIKFTDSIRVVNDATILIGKAKGNTVSIDVYKTKHLYTVIARYSGQTIRDSVIYNLRVKTDSKIITVRDQTAENLCTVYKNKITNQNITIISLIVVSILSILLMLYFAFRKLF